MCKKQGGTLPYALLILLQSVLYGFGNPLSKIGFESITVLWCLGIRVSGAAALMLLLFGRRTVRTLRAAPLKAWLPCSLAMAAAQATVTGVLCLAAALIFDDVAVLPQGTVTGWLVVAYLALLCTCLSYVLQNTALTRLSSYTVSLLQCTQPILTAACSYLLLGGEAVGDRTGGSGAYRGLRGAGKLAERPKANRIRIRGRSFLNVLLFSYKETFAVEIGRFLTIAMFDAR